MTLNDTKEKKPAFELIVFQIESAAQTDNMVMLERFCYVLENMREIEAVDLVPIGIVFQRIEEESTSLNIKNRVKQCGEHLTSNTSDSEES